MCTAVKQVSATAFTDFATSVSKKCTNNPVYSAVCSGGFNPDAVEEAIKNLFKQAVTAKVAIADAISTATDYLLSFVCCCCCCRICCHLMIVQCCSHHSCNPAAVLRRPRSYCSLLLH